MQRIINEYEKDILKLQRQVVTGEVPFDVAERKIKKAQAAIENLKVKTNGK